LRYKILEKGSKILVFQTPRTNTPQLVRPCLYLAVLASRNIVQQLPELSERQPDALFQPCSTLFKRIWKISAGSQAKPTYEQWQALITLHLIPLKQRHDFPQASQHTFARPAFRRLASKYAMPAHMWRHSIHSFLELLRHNLKICLQAFHLQCIPVIVFDHMLAFIYLTYSMMDLLCEKHDSF